MSKKPKAPSQPEAPAEALRHNPFAALAGVSAPAAAPEVVAREAARSEPGPAPKLGGKITVRRETKGRGGKTVTRITGLPAARLEELLGLMKRSLGCGGTLEGEDLLLLGALVPRAAAFLRAEGAKQVVEGN